MDSARTLFLTHIPTRQTISLECIWWPNSFQWQIHFISVKIWIQKYCKLQNAVIDGNNTHIGIACIANDSFDSTEDVSPTFFSTTLANYGIVFVFDSHPTAFVKKVKTPTYHLLPECFVKNGFLLKCQRWLIFLQCRKKCFLKNTAIHKIVWRNHLIDALIQETPLQVGVRWPIWQSGYLG